MSVSGQGSSALNSIIKAVVIFWPWFSVMGRYGIRDIVSDAQEQSLSSADTLHYILLHYTGLFTATLYISQTTRSYRPLNPFQGHWVRGGVTGTALLFQPITGLREGEGQISVSRLKRASKGGVCLFRVLFALEFLQN